MPKTLGAAAPSFLWYEMRSIFKITAFFTLALFSLSATAIETRPYNGALNKAAGSIIEAQIKNGKLVPMSTSELLWQNLKTGATDAGKKLASNLAEVPWPFLLAQISPTRKLRALALASGALLGWQYDDDEARSVRLDGSGMGTRDPQDLPTAPTDFAAMLNTYGVGQDLFFVERSGVNAGQVRRFRTLAVACPTDGTSCLSTNFGFHMDQFFMHQLALPPESGPYYANKFRRRSSDWKFFEIVFELVRTSEPILPPAYESLPITVQQAIQDLPAEIEDLKISVDLLHDSINQLFEANAELRDLLRQYPITRSDVQQWMERNPSQVPTVGDWVRPVAPPDSTVIEFPLDPTAPGDGTSGDNGGSSGSGGSSCGGSGQPPCNIRVDESDWADAPSQAGKLLDAYAAQAGQAYQDSIDGIGGFDFLQGRNVPFFDELSNFVATLIPRANCAPIPFGIGKSATQIDFCGFLEKFRELAAWFMWLVTVFYLFSIFDRATTGQSREGTA